MDNVKINIKQNFSFLASQKGAILVISMIMMAVIASIGTATLARVMLEAKANKAYNKKLEQNTKQQIAKVAKINADKRALTLNNKTQPYLNPVTINLLSVGNTTIKINGTPVFYAPLSTIELNCTNPCTKPDYRQNETTNPLGEHRCSSECDCDGARTCSSSGWCSGTSRNSLGPEACSNNSEIDQADNPNGNQVFLYEDTDCKGRKKTIVASSPSYSSSINFDDDTNAARGIQSLKLGTDTAITLTSVIYQQKTFIYQKRISVEYQNKEDKETCFNLGHRHILYYYVTPQKTYTKIDPPPKCSNHIVLKKFTYVIPTIISHTFPHVPDGAQISVTVEAPQPTQENVQSYCPTAKNVDAGKNMISGYVTINGENYPISNISDYLGSSKADAEKAFLDYWDNFLSYYNITEVLNNKIYKNIKILKNWLEKM